MRAAPFHGKPLFEDKAAAIAVLYNFTGQQFGDDAVAWGAWLRANRAVYTRHHLGGQWASVTKFEPPARWTVKIDDADTRIAMITAKVKTHKIPTLQIGDRVRVQLSPSRDEFCSIVLSMSPVVWVPRRKPAHLPCLATRAFIGRITRSSNAVRFVHGGVVKTFRSADEPT